MQCFKFVKASVKFTVLTCQIYYSFLKARGGSNFWGGSCCSTGGDKSSALPASWDHMLDWCPSGAVNRFLWELNRVHSTVLVEQREVRLGTAYPRVSAIPKPSDWQSWAVLQSERERFVPVPLSQVSPTPPPLSRRKWTHGSRPSPPPSPLINTRCLPAPRARQHPVGHRPCPPVSSPSPASPVPGNGRRTKRKTKRSGSAFLAKRNELLSFTSCPSLTFSVKFQHASSEPTHYSLCLTFLNVVDFFFFFLIYRAFLGMGSGKIHLNNLSPSYKSLRCRGKTRFF